MTLPRRFPSGSMTALQHNQPTGPGRMPRSKPCTVPRNFSRHAASFFGLADDGAGKARGAPAWATPSPSWPVNMTISLRRRRAESARTTFPKSMISSDGWTREVDGNRSSSIDDRDRGPGNEMKATRGSGNTPRAPAAAVYLIERQGLRMSAVHSKISRVCSSTTMIWTGENPWDHVADIRLMSSAG
jgi:hypothetical protein